MAIFAVVTAIGTIPEPTIALLFNGIQEEFTNNIGGCLGILVLAQNDLLQFALIPIAHSLPFFSGSRASLAIFFTFTKWIVVSFERANAICL